MKTHCNKPCDSDASHSIHQCCHCSIEKRSKTTQSVVSSVASNNHFMTSSLAPPTMSISASGKDACEWSLLTTDSLLDILFEYHHTGKTSGKTVRETVWLEVQVELLKRTNVNYTVTQIKEKYKRLKKDWSTFHQFVISTHGVWNPLRFTIDVTPQELEKMKDNTAFKKLQKKGMKRYDVMTAMWAGGTANGVFARSCNNAGPSIEEEREMSHTDYSFAPVGGSGGKITSKSRFHIHSPYSTSQSNSSSRKKFEDLQCAVMKTFLEESSVNAGLVKWTVEECIADVRKVDGVTAKDVVKAGAMFISDVNRNIYMTHTAEEKVIWVNTYCREGGSN